MCRTDSQSKIPTTTLRLPSPLVILYNDVLNCFSYLLN